MCVIEYRLIAFDPTIINNLIQLVTNNYIYLEYSEYIWHIMEM